MNRINHVLITGGGGFLAPHLVSQVLSFSDVTLHSRKIRTFENRTKGRLNVTNGSLDVDQLNASVPGKIDAIIHLAGAVHGPSVESILDSNIVTTRTVLDFMRLREIEKIVFLSTASVWSDSEGVRLNESVNANPSTLYGYAKLAAERLIINALECGDIYSAVILRCNNTYGPGSVQGAVAKFRDRLLAGAPLQIQGDGQQLREPLYVSDLVNIIVSSLQLGPGIHLYGVSGPRALTVLDMARKLADVMGKELTLEWKPDSPERTRNLLVDTEKARRELNWVPMVQYEDGVSALCGEEHLIARKQGI